MARTIRDLSLTNALTAQTDLVIDIVEINIGATGAVGTQVVGCAGVTFTRTGAGTYTLVYPAAVAGALIPYVAKSAAPTVFDCSVTARNVTAGTATIVFANAAGAATDPANGDIVGLLLILKGSAPANNG
jgi:hypothetical protein